MPPSAANAALLDPACGSEAGAILVSSRIGHDVRPASTFRLSRTPAVKHRGCVPGERARQVAADTKPVYLKDAASIQSWRNRVPDHDDAEHRVPVENALTEPPRDRRIAMSVMAPDKRSGDRE